MTKKVKALIIALAVALIACLCMGGCNSKTPVGASAKVTDAMEAPEAKAQDTITAPSTTTSTQEEEHSYVVNVNSGKLHLPDCSSVDQMNESNKRYITCTRSEAVSRWSPCQRCCP